jgi:hypothetical protein
VNQVNVVSKAFKVSKVNAESVVNVVLRVSKVFPVRRESRAKMGEMALTGYATAKGTSAMGTYVARL